MTDPTFSDSDLARLKEELDRTDWVVDPKELKALLARLEAAEAICEHADRGPEHKPLVPVSLIEDWRKRCGK